MKVAMIIYTEHSKDVRVDKEVNTLRTNGINTSVYSYEVSNNENFNGYKRIKLNKKSALFRYIQFYKKLKKELVVNRPEVIHSHDLLALPIGYCLSKRLKTKFIFDAHELYHTLHNYKKVKRFLLKFLLPKVDYLITVNESIEEIYRKQFKVKNTLVLKNTPSFEINSSEKLMRNTLGLNKSDKILLFQGYIVREKGVEVLIDILKHLDEEYKLVYMGMIEDSYKNELLELIAQKGCSERIYFLDAVPYNLIYSFTSDADFGIYLPNSKEENNYYSLPNKVFEYLASGLNIIVADLPELSSLVSNNNVGLVLSDVNNTEKCATEIQTFEFQEFEKGKFHWSNEENKLLGLYKNILR